ncbi:MAG: GTPase [Acidaminococcus sp.]|uniref:GTPase n=1 Tax=Acidaminococcus sp. TaxID=1872103 RepID=UPI003F1593C1
MEVREKKIEDIQKSLEQKRQNLLDATEKVYIINAGRMNHGKSSLMNAVLGKEAFKVADIRQTIKNQYEEYQKNVFLVDTPGLDANSEDDQEAFVKAGL